MYVYGADIEVTNAYVSDLETKASAAASIANQISDFISNSKKNLVGEVYDAYRSNLEVYVEAYKKLSQLCQTLASNINDANSGFSSYVSGCPDGDPVDMRHIPIYEAQIKEMEARIAELEKVGPDCTTDSDGNETCDYSPVERAQAEIAELQAKIADLKKKIAYIQRLPGEDSKACGKIEAAISEINQFVSNVNSINVSNIS